MAEFSTAVYYWSFQSLLQNINIYTDKFDSVSRLN